MTSIHRYHYHDNRHHDHVWLIVYRCLLISLLFGIAQSDLRSDLNDFSVLIPRRRISYIAVRYYILDQNFRNAFEYIRGGDFQETWHRIRAASEFQHLVDYVTRNASSSSAVTDVTNLVANVPIRLRSIQLPSKVPVDAMMLMQERKLGNFLKDIVRILPRRRIADLMARKVHEDGDFAKIYKALRSIEFENLLDKFKSSENLLPMVNELNENSINVDEVIEIGFKVLKWGP